jgi:hypothetical protein
MQWYCSIRQLGAQEKGQREVKQPTILAEEVGQGQGRMFDSIDQVLEA